MTTPITFPRYTFVGPHMSISGLSSAQPVTFPAGAAANGWLVQAVGQNVRIKFDGNNPSASSGFQIRAGDPPFLLVAPNNAFFFYAIQETASATLEVQAVSQ